MQEPSGSGEAPGGLKKLCRTCVDFKTWMREHGKQKQAEGKPPENTPPSTSQPEATSQAPDRPPPNCPLDKDSLGRNTWSFLHTMAAYYPQKPSPEQQANMSEFVRLFAQFYPCDFCAEDMRKDIQEIPPATANQDALADWLCRLHNRVNKKMGKPEFDCKLVHKRWRDGWEDGSCG